MNGRSAESIAGIRYLGGSNLPRTFLGEGYRQDHSGRVPRTPTETRTSGAMETCLQCNGCVQSDARAQCTLLGSGLSSLGTFGHDGVPDAGWSKKSGGIGARIREGFRRLKRWFLMKILIIDDDEGMRILAKHTFESKGHEVIEAETFTNGLRRVIEQQPDAVFYDLRLPDQHETEAAANLAKLKEVLPKMARIIAISGVVDDPAISGV